MIISIDVGKAFDKVWHPFMIKTQQSGNRGSIPQYNKGHIWEIYSQHHTQWAKTKIFPTKIRNKTSLSTFITSIQHSIGSPSHRNQTRKRNKRHPNWKGGTKTVIIYRWHESVHIKPCGLHKKTTQPNKWIWQNSGLQSQYTEIKGIFVHQQWNIRNKLGGEIPFATATRKIKYLGINLNKVAKDLYS